MVTGETIIGIVAGVVIAIVVGAVFFIKTRKDIGKAKKELKEELTDTMIEVENASKRVGDGGKVSKHDDKIIAAHERHIQEPHVEVTDSVHVKVRRWHSDPNGSETSSVTGERGYYTDE